jgi:hypothetical protein
MGDWGWTYRELADNPEATPPERLVRVNSNPRAVLYFDPDMRDDNDNPMPVRGRKWSVVLPHQCDEWTIAEGEDKAEVLRALWLFKLEIEDAIRELEGGG